ncbi:MAG: energy transducer TonB [Mangrovibacterium sp.]
MELKKTNKANLENKRVIFMQVGLVLTLGAIFFAFEQSTQAEPVEKLGVMTYTHVEPDVVPITRVEIPKPPSPPMRVIEEFVIVEDHVPLIDEIPEIIVDDVPIVVAPAIAQKAEEATDSGIICVFEQMPEFPGGVAALRAYISKTVKYPTSALNNNVQGTVYISFVVNQDGGIEDVKVLRGVDPDLNEEAIRVVQSMPKWKPGMQGGKAVRVSYQVPVKFEMQ